ncbi:N-acetylmuramidase family protein [Yersinia canariae]|uniref:N-acetylmuramidase family protein n=2 Tax=Yersinia canariae TaxID=2607663 RepID=A0A857F5S0_9GAMM|nr:N-acetylmuramidase family protein [Yersinia canariae]
MSKVDAFKSGAPVWHFHPVMFLGAISNISFPVTPIKGKLEPLEFITFYKGDLIDDADYQLAATKLSCEVAAIKAVAQTETGNYGSYFKFQSDDDYVPAILFERHHFSKYTHGEYDSHSDISNPDAGGYGTISVQYPKLIRAYALNKRAALMSASWGKFQILGSNYAAAGYSSPEAFVMAMSESEKNQLKAFVDFIKFDVTLLKSIRSKDWLTFARAYNGKRQKGYDKKMEKNYEINKK